MPFIPHTDDEIRQMLEAVKVARMDDLFDEVPAQLRNEQLDKVPQGMGESELAMLMNGLAQRDGRYVNFIGGGVYEHHIPAAVWELTTRGEFYTAYTPYQAEASQGTLQLLYEFQTMITSLTGLDVANASLYDGASALAEAVLAAVRGHKHARRVVIPRAVSPVYRQVVTSIVRNQNIELIEADFDKSTGQTPVEALAVAGGDVAAVVIPQPNYFGVLEDVDALTDRAHDHGAFVIALVNPVMLALLKSPGQWGRDGADFAVGEGQPLGVPLSSGGPYFGFMCCKQKLVRQMPGRIVGRTVDVEGRAGFTLTLQAREQHIRRSKATSNICTNQGLMVTAATIHMALLGPQGLRRVAAQCHANTRRLAQVLSAIDGVDVAFSGVPGNEVVLRLNQEPAPVLRALEAQSIIGGIDLSAQYPELGNALLTCATEVRTQAQIDEYALHLARILSRRRVDPPRARKVAAE